MEPGPVRAGDAGAVGERVDRSGVGGAGRADDREQDLARRGDPFGRAGQQPRIEPVGRVDRDRQHAAFAEPELRRGPGEREVRDRGAQDPQSARGLRRNPRLGRVHAVDPGDRRVPGEQQREQVGLGAAGGHRAGAGRAEGELAERLEHAGLDDRRGRALIPRVLRRVERADQPVRGQRDRIRRAVQVGRGERVRRAHRVVGQVAEQGVERGGAET